MENVSRRIEETAATAGASSGGRILEIETRSETEHFKKPSAAAESTMSEDSPTHEIIEQLNENLREVALSVGVEDLPEDPQTKAQKSVILGGADAVEAQKAAEETDAERSARLLEETLELSASVAAATGVDERKVSSSSLYDDASKAFVKSLGGDREKQVPWE